jgi:hypothetical protein
VEANCHSVGDRLHELVRESVESIVSEVWVVPDERTERLIRLECIQLLAEFRR